MVIWESRLSALSVSFTIFFQEGGSVDINCCHLKFEISLKPNSSLILLQDLTFPLLSNNWETKLSHLLEKSRKKINFFSIKTCLLNHRKLDKMQEGSSEEAKKELLY